MHWPPACNINDFQTPPKGCGANLTLFKNNGNQNGKSSHNNNGQQKKPFFKKKFTKQPKTSLKNERPKKNQLEKMVDGMPVCSCVVDRQKRWWCDKCGPEGRWTNSHHTAEHDLNFSFDKKSNKKNGESHGQVNIREGLAPQCNLWLAEVKLPPSKPRNHFRQ